MSDRYELATLDCHLLDVGEVAKAARAWIALPEAEGREVGVWRSEIGTLGRVFVLRRYADDAALMRERHRALSSSAPFGAGKALEALSVESYAGFDFLPPPVLRPDDRIFEFRRYLLRPGGLPATLAGWRDAIAPARDYTARLVINMHALDGAPRITHIWGFASIQQRFDLREAAYGAGVWPPRGGPQSLVEASSTIALPIS